MGFKDRVVLISGGGTGIGLGAARLFADEGAHVVITGRREEKLKAACGQAGDACRYVVGDVTKPEDCDRMVAETVQLHGKLDVLVNNAGVIGNGGVADTTPEEFNRVMQPNVYGVYNLTHAAVGELVKTRGAIVNVSSVTGTRPYGNLLAYCASKAAVSMMTQTMALELAPQGVRVNAVEPGVVRSELRTRHTRCGSKPTRKTRTLYNRVKLPTTKDQAQPVLNCRTAWVALTVGPRLEGE